MSRSALKLPASSSRNCYADGSHMEAILVAGHNPSMTEFVNNYLVGEAAPQASK